MDERRLDRFLRELGKVVFGACCALGGLVGLWTGIWSSAQIESHGSLGHDLVGMLKPMLAHFGAGLGAGVAFGLVLCLTVLKPRTGG